MISMQRAGVAVASPAVRVIPAGTIPRHAEPVVERGVAAGGAEGERVSRGTLAPPGGPRGECGLCGGFGGEGGEENGVAKLVEVGERDVERIAGEEADGGLGVHVLREELGDPAGLVENAGDVERKEPQRVGRVVAAAADEIGAGAVGERDQPGVADEVAGVEGKVAEDVAAVDEVRAKGREAAAEREEVEVPAPGSEVERREVLGVENVHRVVVPGLRRKSVVKVGDVLLHFGQLLAESVGGNAVEEIQPAGD